MCIQCNIEVHLQNHSCHGKAISITYSKCVSIAVVIQCWQKVIEYKMCVLIFSTIHTIKPTNALTNVKLIFLHTICHKML